MSNSQPTTIEPLKFFEDFFLYGGIEKFKDDFFEYWKNQEKENYEKVTVFEELFESVQVYDGNRSYKMITFSEAIETKLEEEFKVARRLLIESISEQISKFNDASQKITLWSVSIQEIYDQSAEIFKFYPVCVTYLNKLLAILNSRLVKEQEIPLFKIPLLEQDLIKNLFSFLITNKIISIEAYNSLLLLLKVFLKDFSIPALKETDKFDIKDENKSIVQFCFYVLYRNIPNSRGKRKEFVSMLENIFLNYKGDVAINSHFADIPRKEVWHSDIIKKKIDEELIRRKK